MTNETCPKCKKPRYRDEAFCFECNYIWPMPAPIPKAEPQPYQIPNICVVCRSPNIQKISGIVAAQSGRIDGTGLIAPSFINQSELVKRFAPPAPYPLPKQKQSVLVSSNGLLGGIGCFGSIGFTLLGSYAGMPWAFVGVALCFVLGLLSVKTRPLTSSEAHAEMVKVESARAHNQQREYAWNRVYYCGKCDNVFDPVTGKHASSIEASILWS